MNRKSNSLQTHPTFKKLFTRASVTFVSGVLILALMLEAGCSSGSDSFQVTHEVLLEPGTAAQPLAIIRTPDDGYVITAKKFYREGLVIKTDAQGKVLWRYSLAAEGDPALHTITEPNFTGATPLPDGKILLCGYYQKKNESRLNGHGSVVGLLVQLDSTGHLIEKKDLFPNGDKSYPLSYIQTCLATDSGTQVLIGSTSTFGDNHSMNISYWVVMLDATGAITKEVTIPISMSNVDGFSRPRKLSNGDFIFSAWRSGADHGSGTELVRIDSAGKVRERRVVEDISWLVRSANANDPIRLMSVWKGNGYKSIVTLNDALEVQDKKTGLVEHNIASLAYDMHDGTIVVFGSHSDGIDDANIVKWGLNFQKDIQEFRFEKTLRRGYSDYKVEDAIPTGTPNEFATVRSTIESLPDGKGPGPASGIRLAFVKIN